MAAGRPGARRRMPVAPPARWPGRRAGPAERKTFSDAVNSLGEPLSKLAAAVVVK
ncbi:hypothetical protein ABT263_35030 [Kitasatospora sp. NPDC001603]|uniref:hypothetical protein n=1 Tax=Kitasatospora sp. NPDC001603 TaxID=3154388 RepID=UPI003319F181